MSPPPLRDYEEAVRLYLLGVPIAEIGRRQDPPVSRQTMWNALKRRGVLKPLSTQRSYFREVLDEKEG